MAPSRRGDKGASLQAMGSGLVWDTQATWRDRWKASGRRIIERRLEL